MVQATPTMDCTQLPVWHDSVLTIDTEAVAALPLAADMYGPTSICASALDHAVCLPARCQGDQLFLRSQDEWIECPPIGSITVATAAGPVRAWLCSSACPTIAS
jgi:hypothetical protein